MASQFTSEIDKQLKAEEFREKLRKEGDTLGVEHIQGTVRQALDRAKDFEDSIVREPIAGTEPVKSRPSSNEQPAQASTQPAATSNEQPATQIDKSPKPQPDQANGEHTKPS
ncbi:hypothetical protein GCM10022278_26230 [Allohahella marinimesophila]|uniref:Uncharacterized protein n=2 Tax=Allohahella marinimesophila TaxID=1054972 RepID=A0ABP7PKN6_9GAMM